MTLAKACELCPEECHLTKHEVVSEEDAGRNPSSTQQLLPGEVTGQQQHTEPDEQEALDEQDTSPPEDTALYPHSPGTKFQPQNNLPLTQPYTGPAAQHVNNPQRPGPRAQENWEPPEEVPPSQTKD
ncbi:probable ubiquitin carboxyl-terminal hydrolase FAF-X [Carassius auratus]|nr:probable ubiquitin carboxyl-terminal hydrolase FAF-X [Carassius auratus]